MVENRPYKYDNAAMGASAFFILYVILALIFVSRIVSALFGRSKPTINMGDHIKPKVKPFSVEFFDLFSQASQKQTEKSLNCPFQFSGRSYDAFEVLEVPAGAPLEVCRQAYQNLPKTDLRDAAIKALQNSRFS